MALEIVQIRAGQMANFSYLLYCPISRLGVAVDPSFEPQRLLQEAAQRQVTIELLINTHGHGDHLAGNPVVLQATGARLAGHPADLPQADLPLEEGAVLAIGQERLQVLHTPGHSPGSITLHHPGALITGDTLFVTFVGRADLAGSDAEALYHSLRRLAAFPPETLIFPGHDYGPQPVSSIAFELAHNPFLAATDLTGFLRLRNA
jgi:hydroxyacylglutathione hydrolase